MYLWAKVSAPGKPLTCATSNIPVCTHLQSKQQNSVTRWTLDTESMLESMFNLSLVEACLACIETCWLLQNYKQVQKVTSDVFAADSAEHLTSWSRQVQEQLPQASGTPLSTPESIFTFTTSFVTSVLLPCWFSCNSLTAESNLLKVASGWIWDEKRSVSVDQTSPCKNQTEH